MLMPDQWPSSILENKYATATHTDVQKTPRRHKRECWGGAYEWEVARPVAKWGEELPSTKVLFWIFFVIQPEMRRTVSLHERE